MKRPTPPQSSLRWLVPLKAATDVLLWSLAAPLAFFLRVEAPIHRYGTALVLYTLIGIPLKTAIVLAFRLHRQSWRHASVRDLSTLLRAVGAGLVSGMMVVYVLRYPLPPFFGVHFPTKGIAIPRSVPFIEALLGVIVLGGTRLVARRLSESVQKQRYGRAERYKRVLIVGAGEAGTLLAREALHHPETGIEPVGFLDDDPYKAHSRIMGIPVVGTLDDLPKAVKKFHIDEVFIALPSAEGKVIRRVVRLCHEAGVPQRIMPALYEILSGRVTLSTMREIRLEDLLRREPVRLDMQSISQAIDGKRVLITGAGGSIGSEIVRQVMRFHPQKVILVGRGENSLYLLTKEIHRKWSPDLFEIYVADIRFPSRLQHIFQRTQPQIVFHAAAHKHVPLMETNPEEAILNNVFGTWNLVQCARESATVERFVNISTDKAVNPTSVMGASKRIAEYIVQVAAAQAKPHQIFVSVRFGNVLGSRGSVVPLFMEQVRQGGPITITHPEMRRFFMLIPEAAQLVLQAAALGHNGATYLLDMGDPVKIVDLAKDIIMLSGFTPDEIPIVFTGLRPGEKLFEELSTEAEEVVPGPHKKIWEVNSVPIDHDWLQQHLRTLKTAAESGNAEAVRRALQAMIPTYRPTNG